MSSSLSLLLSKSRQESESVPTSESVTSKPKQTKKRKPKKKKSEQSLSPSSSVPSEFQSIPKSVPVKIDARGTPSSTSAILVGSHKLKIKKRSFSAAEDSFTRHGSSLKTDTLIPTQSRSFHQSIPKKFLIQAHLVSEESDDPSENSRPLSPEEIVPSSFGSVSHQLQGGFSTSYLANVRLIPFF